MTWIFSDGTNATTNVTPANAVEAVFRLKELLKNAGSIIAASGDGLSASGIATYPYTSHADVITGFGSGANGMNNNYAWFIVKLPDGRMFGFQRGTSTMQWRNKYMPRDLIGAVQVLTASGTPSTAMATAPTENYIKGTSGTYAGWFGADGSYRFNAGADNGTGSGTYSFYMACWTSGTALTSTCCGTMLFDSLLPNSYPAEDIDPCVIYHPDYSSSYESWTTSYYGGESSTFSPKCYFRRGMATAEGFVVCSALGYATGTTLVFPVAAGSNPHNMKDDGLPVVYARRAALGYPSGFKGVSATTRWLAAARGNGQALNLTGTRDRIAVGHISLPWDGSVPVI